MSLGVGLSKLAGRVFRIGHLGSFNDLMLIGTLGGVEMGLRVAGIPHREGGVMAAIDVTRARAAPPNPRTPGDRGRSRAGAPKDQSADAGVKVRFDAGSRALYASDASNYRQVPIGLVVPRDAEDVAAAVAVCRRVRRAGAADAAPARASPASAATSPSCSTSRNT